MKTPQAEPSQQHTAPGRPPRSTVNLHSEWTKEPTLEGLKTSATATRKMLKVQEGILTARREPGKVGAPLNIDAIIADRILEESLHKIANTDLKEIGEVILEIRECKRQYLIKNKLKKNADYFTALRYAARVRSVLSRIQTLKRDKLYRRICKDRESTVAREEVEIKRTRLSMDEAASRFAKIDRFFNEIAGVLFQIPRLIPIKELIETQPRTKKDLLWGEPVPIMLVDGDEEAVNWHWAPALPFSSADPFPSSFLWGRRALWSLPIDAILQDKVDWDDLQGALRFFCRQYLEDWAHWVEISRARLFRVADQRIKHLIKNIPVTAGSRMDITHQLGYARKQYKTLGSYYRKLRGTRRTRKVHARKSNVHYTSDLPDLLLKISAIETHIAEANARSKEITHVKKDTVTDDDSETSVLDSLPTHAASDVPPVDFDEARGWMMENLHKFCIDPSKVTAIIEQFTEDYSPPR